MKFTLTPILTALLLANTANAVNLYLYQSSKYCKGSAAACFFIKEGHCCYRPDYNEKDAILSMKVDGVPYATLFQSDRCSHAQHSAHIEQADKCLQARYHLGQFFGKSAYWYSTGVLSSRVQDLEANDRECSVNQEQSDRSHMPLCKNSMKANKIVIPKAVGAAGVDVDMEAGGEEAHDVFDVPQGTAGVRVWELMDAGDDEGLRKYLMEIEAEKEKPYMHFAESQHNLQLEPIGVAIRYESGYVETRVSIPVPSMPRKRVPTFKRTPTIVVGFIRMKGCCHSRRRRLSSFTAKRCMNSPEGASAKEPNNRDLTSWITA
ncbi:hypothetical protein BJ508DRAFT_341687 [Ascobolus immersus RN42]|uniref:Uncharacterized protein n=1 Tax=Ascobolus immersus RN42 TaxID=1160509 RepID=A0A3N4HJU5_ASCIM|nr:hypothetical protein BJ508DRAFT_341687 [Ascobolus immersus RN42]